MNSTTNLGENREKSPRESAMDCARVLDATYCTISLHLETLYKMKITNVLGLMNNTFNSTHSIMLLVMNIILVI